MKTNLLIGGKPLNGYLNIDVLAQPNHQDRVAGDITNLDAVVDNNECQELLAIDVIDFVPLQIRQQTLQNWSNKIAHGGIITVSAVDLVELARLISSGQLADVVEINKSIFGIANNVWQIRKSYIPLQDTVQMLVQSGQFEIQSVHFKNFNYYITARRK